MTKIAVFIENPVVKFFHFFPEACPNQTLNEYFSYLLLRFV